MASSVLPEVSCLLACLQLWAEGLAAGVTSSQGFGRVSLHLPLPGRLLSAVPGMVVLVRQPERRQSPHVRARTPTPAPPAGGPEQPRLSDSDRSQQQDLPTVPMPPRKLHRPVNVRLRLLLPLHLHIREGQPPLPGHRLPQWTTTPH